MPLGNIEPTRNYTYMQYRPIKWMQDFNDMLHDMIKEDYFDFLYEMIDSINLQDSRSRLLFFYAFNYLGLPKPWGQPYNNTFYDDGQHYDSDKADGDGTLVYDDFDVDDGHIAKGRFIMYTKFVFDYSRPVLDIDTLITFVANYCNIKKGDIKIIFKPGRIHIAVTPTPTAKGFLTMVRSNVNICGLPMGNLVRFWADGTLPPENQL